MAQPKLLIVGARPCSLGDLVRIYARESGRFSEVVTAGVTEEDHVMDVRDVIDIGNVLELVSPDYLLCTVGINDPAGLSSKDLVGQMMNSFLVNAAGPLELLRQFAEGSVPAGDVRKFAVISSNSARIARTGSVPYCASKAALSMGLRVLCRELARAKSDVVAWGYEPGLLAGTPMTEATIEHFSAPNHGLGIPPLHRMPGVGPEGLDPEALARRIVNDFAMADQLYHSAVFTFDAGEQ